MAVKTMLPTDYQMHLFHEGTLFDSHRLFGAHVIFEDGKTLTRFAVWAPNAKEVRVVGDFNSWNGDDFKLHRMNNEGVWHIVIEKDLAGCLYKYEILTQEGTRLHKADPYAFYSEKRPGTASVVWPLEGYKWNDQSWLKGRMKKNTFAEPAVIYEMHAGTWKRNNGNSLLNYRELADEIVPYVLEHGFTHVELLPLVEHPLDASWGYQGTGYFSPTSRYGKPQDFMYFVDQCHQHNIGVILDWVPGHFCKDAHGLYKFDGTHLFEYKNEKDRENYVWGTSNFDLGRNEVQSFLISNALFWLETYHIDGFRMDAVSNIIYWPNSHEQHQNPYGIEFLRKLNSTIRQYDPSIFLAAEDSSNLPQVTSPAHYGGLGFHYKWNMGWMNDVLAYMETSPEARSGKHGNITFSLLYAFKENFILPLSHDEVVHGKKSLLNKMPGDYWRKFAQFRLLLGYMMAHPGKKLLFMGFEIAQFSEWKDSEELDWNLMDYEMHQKANRYTKDLIRLYRRSRPLFELDHVQEGFEWIDADNREQSIFSFVRFSATEGEHLIAVCNFTADPYRNFRIGVPHAGSYREIFNSDKEEYGGSGWINKKVVKTEELEYHGRPYSIQMAIPPFGITILRPVKHRKERKGNGKDKMCGHAAGRGKRIKA
ncbi:1,4-alpha-glucan branching protein GlgB [Bacillus infantis]|uniref:1,4-alpha-glucan branching protein GlgB n=1 Tax=Bacillus infantis TaxID=324767 RepID=UPI00101DD30C|nr:1,4-alpha-glucan branching protein GlgB [Bacillus infantis]RYI25230.1 1,4-alpha-glucan branching protein GlgB [Bacillus infantis]